MKDERHLLRELLLQSKSISEFLVRAEAELKNSEMGFSYASFARNAGFSARSYVREVFQGKKPLTLKALPGFSKAFGLNKEEREILKCLLLIEFPGMDPGVSAETAQQMLFVKRKALARRAERKKPLESFAPLKGLDEWPVVYAGLGEGSTVDILLKKTKLTALSLERALQAMMALGIVSESEGVYSPVGRHLVLSPEVHAEMIRTHFQSVLERASRLAGVNFRDPQRMYFVSSYSVRKSRMPELKAKLIETLLRFVDETECAQDDEIVSLAAAFI